MPARMSASAPIDHLLDQPLGYPTADPAPSQHPTRVAMSFEVIPPRNEDDASRLDNLLDTLAQYNPDYVAVTSSQRSGWLEGTARFIERISTTTNMRPLAHLACTAGPVHELSGWIDRLVDSGVRGLLALRGDLPPGEDRLPPGYLPHADSLVRLIRQRESEQLARLAAGRIAVGVACYPNGHSESANTEEDFDVLLAKQRLGADFAITQLFFDAEDYLRFLQRARLAGVRIPLIPGIMPVTTPARLERMSQLSGIPVPDRLRQRLESNPDSGLEITVELARACLEGGAPGLHLYTHNDAPLTTEIMQRLGV
ncbi:methylenetetrahydrofolate reductase [Corynebacterium lizhenjunii]|uniref:methylenetetrahydrofolate reductase n=1 Tax=Corynebacterium lizhenjunii TaxID=2709394 RepID=UPI0013EC09A4|nr:methylenetetrahydrofolate reductase [Corynebacterium lizhenjunii]